LQAVEYSIPVGQSILQRPAQENIADFTEFFVNGLFIHSIGKALSYGATFAKIYLSGAAESMAEVIAPHLMHEPFHFATTSAGDVAVCIDRTGQIISDVAQVAAAAMVDGTLLAAKYIAQGKVLSDKVQQLTHTDKEKIIELQKNIEPYLRCDKIISPERLRATKGIKQIEHFREKTNNFDPKMLESLHPDEKLYLNLCDWLYPQSVEINEKIKAVGGLIIRDPNNANIFVKIEEFDLFHSLLGEMKLGSIRQNLKGGHMMIPEFKSALCEMNEMQTYWDGFIDLQMKLKRGNAESYITKSFFPHGSSPADCTNIIENAIKNVVNNPTKIQKFLIETDVNNVSKFTIEIENSLGHVFRFYIKDGSAQFFPLSPR